MHRFHNKWVYQQYSDHIIIHYTLVGYKQRDCTLEHIH